MKFKSLVLSVALAISSATICAAPTSAYATEFPGFTPAEVRDIEIIFESALVAAGGRDWSKFTQIVQTLGEKYPGRIGMLYKILIDRVEGEFAYRYAKDASGRVVLRLFSDMKALAKVQSDLMIRNLESGWNWRAIGPIVILPPELNIPNWNTGLDMNFQWNHRPPEFTQNNFPDWTDAREGSWNLDWPWGDDDASAEEELREPNGSQEDPGTVTIDSDPEGGYYWVDGDGEPVDEGDDAWESWLDGFGCFPPMPKRQPRDIYERRLWWYDLGSIDTSIYATKYVLDLYKGQLLIDESDIEDVLYESYGTYDILFPMTNNYVPLRELTVIPHGVVDQNGVYDVVWEMRYQNHRMAVASAGHAWCPVN